VNTWKSYPETDLDEISSRSPEFIERFSNSSVLVAGTTGFVGSWILSSIQHMNQNHGTNIKVTGVARHLDQNFTKSFPEINFIKADLSKPSLNLEEKPDCVFNAATPSSPIHGGEEPKQVMDAAITGTQNLIKAVSSASISTFVNLSSGIVTKRSKDQNLNTDNIKDAYLQAKRNSEELIEKATADGIIAGKNLRLYAFAGPGISLSDHFAVGNFMNDALRKVSINIKGNPETRRSYLYPTDLMANVLKAATSQKSEILEVGSLSSISMRELATVINHVTGNFGISQATEYGEKDEYLPITAQLLVDQHVPLESAILRWAEWLSND
jgi:nucleoside-diphosphate-sugar epimerase